MSEHDVTSVLETIVNRLDSIDQKLTSLTKQRQKSMEWLAQLAEHVSSLDAFREEVRGSFEPLFGKLEGLDEVMRIMRHATSDVSRRVEQLENTRRRAG